MKKLAYAAGLFSIINTTFVSASTIDPALLLGTWHCSFESNSPEQSLVGTSIDRYFADGTSHSDSKLSLQIHSIGLDVAYEITLKSRWQMIGQDRIEETVVAVPTFLTSNPALEQMISLKDELLNGETESANIIELTANTAIFRTGTEGQSQQDVRCTR